MDEARITAIADRIASQHTAGKLQLGPRKKSKGRNTLSWHQVFKFDPEGWDLDKLMQKVIRYLKKPPTDSIPGYAAPRWFVQFDTSRGKWPVERWDRRNMQTYQKLVENGDLTGKGIAGWVFVEESRSR